MALIPLGIAVSDKSLSLFVGLGVPYALVAAAVFGYVAWQLYEPPARFVDTPATRRVVARSTAAVIAARLIWYVGIVFIAVVVTPTDRILGVVLISILVAASLATSLVVSQRLRRRVAEQPTSNLD